MRINKQSINDAEQQFTGFAQGFYFSDIIGLVRSMGLKEFEWEYLKKEEMINCLEDKEIEEINDYFEEEKK